MTNDFALQRYIAAFENLTSTNLETELGMLFAESVFFKDPFNEVKGKPATLAIFKHMFEVTLEPKFSVQSAARDGEFGLLKWQFEFIQPNNLQTHSIQGMSHIRFNQQQQVIEHIDHWDAGEQVYSHVPLLSWIIKQVNKRLSAH